MLRNALLECLGIHRTLGFWLPGGVLLLLLAAWFQESGAFRPAGVHLFWGALRSLSMLAMALVPLAWILARSRWQEDWLQPRARFAWNLVAPPLAGMVAYGVTGLIACLGVAITLDSIAGRPIPAGWPSLALRALLFGLPVMALAPALAASGWGRPGRLLGWCGCALLSLLLTAPASESGTAAAAVAAIETGSIAILPPLLLGAAGILLSLHQVLRPHPS